MNNMPNWCSFEMKIRAKNKKDIMYLTENYLLENADDIHEKFLPRTFISKDYKIKKIKDYYYTIIDGECAWSCYSCMLEGESTYYSTRNWKTNITLNQICRKLKIAVEVYGWEPGVGFEEHIFINEKGQTIESEGCDYHYEQYDKKDYSTTYNVIFLNQYIDYPKQTIIEKIKTNYLNYFLLKGSQTNKIEYIKALFEREWNDINIINCGIGIKPNIYITKEELEECWNPSFLNRKDIIISLAKGKHTNMINKVFEINKELLEDEEIIKEIITINPEYAKTLPELKKFLPLIDEIEKRNLEKFDEIFDNPYAEFECQKESKELDKKDKELLNIIGKNPEFYKYLSWSFKQSRFFSMELVKRNAKIIGCLEMKFRLDKEIIIEAYKNWPDVLTMYKDDAILDDKEFVIELVKINDYGLCYASKRLQQDKEILHIINK